MANYVRHRPSYPPDVLATMKSKCGLTPKHTIADIASGTGIFTRLLLENGNRVFGVEPNPEMRRAGEEFLAAYEKFTSVNGTAEATTLPDGSVDFVTAAQAAHWFNREKARQEFIRILKPDGWCVLVWNSRQHDASGFLGDYERLLLQYGSDYQTVRHEHTTDRIQEFFHPAPFQFRDFATKQDFDYPSLEGRLLSSSYTPLPSDPKYKPMLQELRRIYDAHQVNGRVTFEYLTHVYFGQISRKTVPA